MREYTKRVLLLPVTILTMIIIAYTWYFIIMRPQRRAATLFLESLRTRNEDMLRQTVLPTEFNTYKYLYFRSGFTKTLKSYTNLRERDANGYFFPTSSRFSIEVKEKDIFFGDRELTYFIVMEKKEDDWRIIQFSSLTDQNDLEELRKIKQGT